MAARRSCRSLWVGACIYIAGCSFEHGVTVDGGARDPDVFVEPVDAPPRSYWAVAAVHRGGSALLLVQPVDETRALAPCPEVHADRVNKALVGHPTRPLVFGVGAGFAGISLGCGSATHLGSVGVGTSRPVQRILYEPDLSVGFFTVDGPNAVGVFRFTVSGDGTPTIVSSADATSLAGALALDREHATLVTAGYNVTASYVLSGTQLDLPASRTNAAGCAQPIDILISGNYSLLFCGDVADVFRYTTVPFAFDSQLGSLGTVDFAVPLPGDRAIAARTTPDLAIIDLAEGSPTWTTGPSLGSRATAMAASRDGRILAIGRQLDATTSELSLWRIGNDALTQLSSQAVDGEITAVSITGAGM